MDGRPTRGVIVVTPTLDRLLDALAHAADHFHSRLDDPAALAYLRSRGIPPALARTTRWRLGYAPPGRVGLTGLLRHRGFTPEELIAAGVAVRPRGGRRAGHVLDVFCDRLMFPVCDRDGRVVGFVGRDLSGSPAVPRYRNTRTTPLYTKSEQLYGLFESVCSGAAPATVLLVEGPADAVALARLPREPAGRVAAVSTCGTALTGAQVGLLARLVPRGTAIVVCFDPDAAGQRAADRAYRLLRGWAGPVDAVVLPSGTDPAALIAGQGPYRAAATLAANRRPLLDVLVAQRVAGHRLDEIEGRVAALRAAGRLLRHAADEVPRDLPLLPTIGRRLGVRLGFDGVTVLESIYPPR